MAADQRLDKRQVLDAYCQAWNRWDLDSLFALFAEHAVYRGTHRTLVGKADIRRMYEQSAASGVTAHLRATVVRLKDGDWGVALWRADSSGAREFVALKRFAVEAGRICEHDLRQGPEAFGEMDSASCS